MELVILYGEFGRKIGVIPSLLFVEPGFPISPTSSSLSRMLSFVKKKGKSVPLQAQSGPEGSRKLRLPDFVTTAQDGGKVVSLTHRPPLPPRKYSCYSFLLEAESTPGP